MLTPELRGLKGPPAAIRRDPKPERQNRQPRSSGRCTRRFELSPGTDPPDEGAGRTGARKPSRAAGQGRRPCDGPLSSCVSPGTAAVLGGVLGRGPRRSPLPAPCGPSLQRLESRRLRAAVLHLLFSHARGLAAGGPGTRVGIAPPPRAPHTHASFLRQQLSSRPALGTDSVGGTTGTGCTPSESAELAPRDAGAGASRRPVGHEEPQGWGAPGQRAGGRSGERKVGVAKWGGRRLAPFNQLQIPGRRHAPCPVAFLRLQPGCCWEGTP